MFKYLFSGADNCLWPISLCVQRLLCAVLMAIVPLYSACAEGLSLKDCKNLSLVAKAMMSSRQSGTEMSKLIEIIGDSRGVVGEFAKDFAVLAYQYPVAHDEEIKKEMMVEFESLMYLQCCKAQKK